MTKKNSTDTHKALKATTFYQLFDMPETILKPVTQEELLEDIPAIALRIVLDVMRDPDTPGYVKLQAAKELLDRSMGKPVTKNIEVIEDPFEGMNREELLSKIRDLLPHTKNEIPDFKE